MNGHNEKQAPKMYLQGACFIVSSLGNEHLARHCKVQFSTCKTIIFCFIIELEAEKIKWNSSNILSKQKLRLNKRNYALLTTLTTASLPYLVFSWSPKNQGTRCLKFLMMLKEIWIVEIIVKSFNVNFSVSNNIEILQLCALLTWERCNIYFGS